MQEQNSFSQNKKNSKKLRIPFLFEDLVHINPTIFNELIKQILVLQFLNHF